MSFQATITLPFGEVSLSATYSADHDQPIAIRRVDVVPQLPDGMAVDLVSAFLIDVPTAFPVYDLTFDCRLAAIEQEGDANSGQYLDAQSWPIGDGLLMIGTEDGEALQARMPWLNFNEDDYPIRYLPDGLRLELAMVPAKKRLDFHFVLAYNHVDRQCDSEWFAVDIAHTTILNSPSAAIASWP